ncbi:hypothetical protein ACVWU4_000885 [Campylobacter coli]
MGLMSTLGTILDVGKILTNTDKSTEEIAEELLKAHQRLVMLSIDGDITRLLQQVTVEPTIIVSKSLKDYEYIDDILAFQTDLFCSYYTQAFDMLTGLYGIKGVAAIQLLGTDNGSISMLINAGVKAGLQVAADIPIDLQTHYVEEAVSLFDKLKNENFSLVTGLTSHSEALKVNPKSNNGNNNNTNNNANNSNNVNNSTNQPTVIQNFGTNTDGKDKDKDPTTKYTFQALSRYDKLDNLQDDILYKTLQRTFKISIQVEHSNINSPDGTKKLGSERTIEVPIVVKSYVLFVDPADIVNMIEPQSKDHNFFSRLDDYKSGAISFKELVLCSDLIAKYKQNKLKDKEGILKLLQSRKVSANSKAVVYNMVGFEKSYNMLILDQNDKATIQSAIRGDFVNNEKYKQDLLDAAHGMTVATVNKDYERIMLGTRSVRGVANLDIKKLNKNKKGKSDDLIELFKAMQLNRTPTF